MNRVISVSAGHDYRLDVTFSDGTSGKIDLSSRLFGSMFEPLRDRDLFAQVRVDEFGAICWPNGADLAPDALYRAIKRSADQRTVLAS
jgi:Protein of unknown function (DUF2442)